MGGLTSRSKTLVPAPDWSPSVVPDAVSPAPDIPKRPLTCTSPFTAIRSGDGPRTRCLGPSRADAKWIMRGTVVACQAFGWGEFMRLFIGMETVRERIGVFPDRHKSVGDTT